jgi:hypothetical protein
MDDLAERGNPPRKGTTTNLGMGLQSSRRHFLASTALVAGGVLVPRIGWSNAGNHTERSGGTALLTVSDLPKGNAPAALPLEHFPSPVHAFVWRNWQLVPVRRLAEVLSVDPGKIRRVALAMGLPEQPQISRDQLRRSSLSIIKRNWHLLPYDQLLKLLGWTPEQMVFSLREDDFLFVKLGNLKPHCTTLIYREPDEETRRRESQIAEVVREVFPEGLLNSGEPLFSFIADLSAAGRRVRRPANDSKSAFSPRFCYSYFALYGDALLDAAADPYPDGYLARLAESGVNGVWLQGLLTRLAPFPWDPEQSRNYKVRLRNLRALVKRARAHGIGVYLYLNEPRALPSSFFSRHPEFRGTAEGDYACLCTSHPQVLAYLKEAVASLGQAVPDLAGIFTITASENLTHCWSHYHGEQCPRCRERQPQQVIADLLGAFAAGLRQAECATLLIAWDWGWQDPWAQGIIAALPREVGFMSVSEWDLPIQRGGIASAVGEYCISAIGPGPRARRHWRMARKAGLKTLAKIQAGNTWELSAVPYIPAVENVARHAANLRTEGVDGLMLGWTLGGYPSPNLEVVAEIGATTGLSPQDAMQAVARRRFGPALAPIVVKAWSAFSEAFQQYPFGSGLYSAPLQLGPANLLWLQPTGYAASMVGFPYDDLKSWCGNYPPEIFLGQLLKVADGFDQAIAQARSTSLPIRKTAAETRALKRELMVADAATIHFRSAALQCQFVLSRERLRKGSPPPDPVAAQATAAEILHQEATLARRLYTLQNQDSRLGFEASNQYYYVPLDLVEKVLNCRRLKAGLSHQA